MHYKGFVGCYEILFVNGERVIQGTMLNHKRLDTCIRIQSSNGCSKSDIVIKKCNKTQYYSIYHIKYVITRHANVEGENYCEFSFLDKEVKAIIGC